MKLSAVVITHNEEDNIADAIGSVKWADEILVVDSESSDRTSEIAAEMGARVLVQPWLGFGKQKQFAAESASNDLILSLDADERISSELADEIRAAMLSGEMADGYRVPRATFYMGRWIKHGDWYPDLQLRLYDRTKGRWSDVPIHESISMDPGTTIRTLKGDILHFTSSGVSHHARMIQERYAPLSAEKMFREGRRATFFSIAASPVAAFAKGYFMRLGFLDGLPGLAIAYFAAYNAFLKHLLLWDLESENQKP